MKYFQLKPMIWFIYFIISFHHYEWKHYEWISNPSPLNIMWNLYKAPVSTDCGIVWIFSVKLFVCIPNVQRYKQRKYNFYFLVRISQYLSKLWDREFLCLILWIARSVHVFCRWGVEMDIFSWKYPNERSRVLLWAMSLTKESEHLASHHLSV